MLFSEKILRWYTQHKRSLPWRSTRDPYKIWLSEIVLQQTRVDQGTPYYLKFIKAFPTVFDLAAAQEGEILKLWQGLGYYARARNLHAAAKMVVREHNGTFPKSYKGLLALPGVGDYTASAIASICFNEPQAVVDGNVYRVLARYFGVELPINGTAGTAYFRKLAQEAMDPKNIRDYNQGIMEFGALQCTPKKPECGKCPLNSSCLALKDGKVATLPVKINRTNIRKRHFNYIVPRFTQSDGNGYTALVQRREKGIWKGLWEFPLLETKKAVGPTYINQQLALPTNGQICANVALFNERTIVHKLSHQHLYTKFWILDQKAFCQHAVPIAKLKRYPVPVLIADFINTFKF